MSKDTLKGCKIAILATNGFEQSELMKPKQLLEEAGATTQVIAPGGDQQIKGWNHGEWGEKVKVDVPVAKASAADYDALVLPGGVINPDKLRMNEDAMTFATAFFDDDKPVAAICHGPWTVIETGYADGRRIASWPSLETDLLNAGAEWVDQPNVTDGNLTSSRSPDDIPQFNDAMITLFARQKTPETA